MNDRRYSRQICLPEIGSAGQDKLSRASVLCIGAGGLGAPALLYLAAAGVGRIGIVDCDAVDESNLQRQIIFTTDDIGASKAAAAAAHLRRLNPSIAIEAHDERLDARNALRLFPAYDIILDGTDNFETKFLINDAAVKFGKPWIYGAISGFDGQVSVFNRNNGPCYRCFQADTPKSAVRNCAEAGVIGAIAGIVGVTQAMQAVQLIVGHDSFYPLAGKIWLLDARTMNTRTLSLKKNEACAACGKSGNEIVLRDFAPAACQTDVFAITPAQLGKMQDCTVIDVREENEWNNGHIDGAMLWPLSKIMAKDMPPVDKNRAIVLYCQKGQRSLRALSLMREDGFSSLCNLTGGYEAFNRAELDLA